MGAVMSIVKMIISFLWFAVKLIGAFSVPFILVCTTYIIIQLIKGKRFKKSKIKRKKTKRNLLRRLFYDFPIQFAKDLMNRDPDEMPISGLHLFAGEQGSGKTISAVQFLKSIKDRYPMCVVRSNINISFQDSIIEDINDIILQNNGAYGQIDLIDELQNWFNSNESKDFPVEMLQEICQQRKQHKVIVGTSQVFTRVSKAFREQVSVLYKPLTVFGCLTIVRAYKPNITEDGTVEKMRMMRMYFFVHSKELRESYDTYEKVKRMSLKGFKPRNEQLSHYADNRNTVNVTVESKKK